MKVNFINLLKMGMVHTDILMDKFIMVHLS